MVIMIRGFFLVIKNLVIRVFPQRILLGTQKFLCGNISYKQIIFFYEAFF